MDANKQALFNRLCVVIDADRPNLSGVFNIIAQVAVSSGEIASAMSAHARDVLMDAPETRPDTLVKEMYRRTFFDEQYACLYNTQHIAQNPAHMASLVSMLEAE